VHPTLELRHWPLVQALEGVTKMARVVVMDSNPLSYEVDEIYCFCNKPDTGELMVICEKCDQSYHAPCVGFDNNMMANDDWLCGYCQSDVCGDGKREWKGEVPIPEGKKRRPKPKPRSDAELKTRLANYAKGGKEWKGPRNWEEVKQKISDHASKLRAAELEKYEKAKARQKEGGHHMFDMAVGGVVRDAPLNHPEVMDMLEGNHAFE
jgi:hypothetical protein